MRKTQDHRLRLAVPAMLALLACGGSADMQPQQAGSTALSISSVSLSATPQTIARGGRSQLVAQFPRGNGTISPGVGRVRSGLPVTVSPSATTTYTLTVSWGWLTASRRVTVTVNGTPESRGGPIAIYSDALAPGWEDWSWVSHNLANPAPVSGGTTSIAVFYGPWNGLSFDLPAGVSGAGAGTLEFDAHGGVTPDPEIHAIAQFGGTWGPEVPVAPYCAGGAIPAGAFTHCAVPLDVLGVADTTFERIALKEGRGLRLPAMYFDQIAVVPQVTAPPPAIQSFSASPASITAGESATLSATYSGGNGSIDNGVGAIASGASVTVAPSATTTYTLTVTDASGQKVTQSATVTVTAVPPPPAIASFSASPDSITAGESATLSATYSGGSGSIDNGVGAIASGGSVTVAPSATTTYTLTVTDASGQKVTQSVTVTVTAVPPPPPAIASFSASPDSITGGETATLSATYSGGAGSIDNGVGAIASGGSVTVTPSATTTYTLTVTDGSGRTAAQSITVTVIAPPAIQSFSASPTSISVGGHATLSATYSGGSGSIDNGVGPIASGGTVTVSPSATTTYTLTVRSASGLVAAQSTAVTVTPAIVVSVAPKAAAVTTGGAASFTATVTGTIAGQSTEVIWSVQEALGGTVDTSGHYTAPATAGTYHVVATSVADPSKNDAATVTVTAIAVAISPRTATVTAGGTSTFTATVTGTVAGQSTAVTWSVQEPEGGTVDMSGHYTAPATAGIYHLIATSVADASKQDTATVTVTAPEISVTISPKVASVVTNGGVSFTATVDGTTPGQSTAVTWSVQESFGGTVDSSGRYTAPAAAGTYHVVAASVADPSRSDAATVSVTTSALIPADRTTAWNPGLNAVGGIPNRTTICRSLAPSGADDTAAIQAALDSCPANQVVQLTAGNFRISDPGINFRTSNITLRGAGPGMTVLTQRATAQYGVIAMGTQWYEWMSPKAFTTDAVKEANSVTLANTTGLTVGQLVHVNETYDSSLIYYNPSQQNGDYQGWGEGRQGPQAASRPVGQAMEIASISGNTVTFTTGFHQTYRVDHSAHLTQISDGVRVVPTTRWSGIEELTVENGSGGDGGGNIRVFASSHCWAKHIESRNQNAGAAFAFDGSFQCEVRDSYLHSAQDPNPGGAGYGIVFDSYTADSLAENNIVWNFNKVSAFRSSGGGNVFAYNYCEDMYGQGYPTIVEVGINASHMAGSHHELFEGNQGPNFDSDSYWGSQMYITAFRNHLTMMRRNIGGVAALGNGVLSNLRDENNKRGIGLTVYQKWYSFVGNVIGVPNGYLQTPAIGFAYPSTFGPGPQGTTFKYEWLGGPFGPDTSPTYTPIWQIGYDGSDWFTTQERTSQATAQRDANYDYFTRQVHWHGIGGTGQNNGLTPPSGVTLPDSLYLTRKPAFFGASPWPWVDGSNASNPLPGVLPARIRFDAGAPNLP